MEKKGDILNQLAIISDLLEKIGNNVNSMTLIFSLPESDFINLFNYFQTKQYRNEKVPKDTFTIKIGNVDIFFNKNNV